MTRSAGSDGKDSAEARSGSLPRPGTRLQGPPFKTLLASDARQVQADGLETQYRLSRYCNIEVTPSELLHFPQSHEPNNNLSRVVSLLRVCKLVIANSLM
eukprot:3901333-Amphidinium_carterae.2